MTIGYSNVGRMYGECILYWMIENAIDIDTVSVIELQEGSGLGGAEFQAGLDWLIKNHLLDNSLLDRSANQKLH